MLHLILLGAGLAHALETGPNVGVGVGWLWTDPAENLESTWSVVPRLGYGLGRYVTLEAEVGLSQGQTRGWGYGYQVASPRGNILFNLAPGAIIEPFAVAGGGIIHKKVRRSPDSWSLDPLDGYDLGNYVNPDTDVLANFGLGAFVPLGGAMALRLDARSILTSGAEPHGDVGDQFANWEATAGVAFRGQELKLDTDGDGLVDHQDRCPVDPEDFDRFEDADGCPDFDNDLDGVVDVEDACPDIAEDMDGFQDADGCPEWDNDMDGLADRVDACPLEREDQDGYHDEDGCPEPDNDGDGIADLKDSCPNHPEDVDGYADFDGCVDSDNDQDGLVDVIDACPDVAENWNGFDDGDGCPDELPADVARFTGVIHGVNFELDRAQITVDSYRILNEAVSVLDHHGQIRLVVEGHTDSDGSDDYNLDLSARRAHAVVSYLVDRGVDAGRLESVGYGETRPLVGNDNLAGRAVNRRVEFQLVTDALTDLGNE